MDQSNNLVSSLPDWIVNPNPEIYLSDNFLVLDFENTIVDDPLEDFITPVDPRPQLVSAAWYYQGVWKFHRGNEYQYQTLLDDIEKADFIVAHGGKHELQWLHRCGADLTKIIIYDTAIGEYVLLGNRRAALDLHSVSRRYGGRGKRSTYARLMKAGVCPSTWPEKWLKEYNLEDVVGTLEVFIAQRVELSRLGLLPTMYTRCLVTPMLADIERHGMQVDKDRVTRIYRKLTEEYNQVMQEMNALTGGINPNSPAQMSKYLYETLGFPMPQKKAKKEKPKTPEQLARAAKRKPQPVLGPTGVDDILKLPVTTDIQRQFIELKKKQAYLHAKLSKSFQKFFDAIEDKDAQGLIKFRFNQVVTSNHRLSSSGSKFGIQGQNLDREVKPVFRSKNPGWKIGEWDYAGIEWRAAGFLSHDPVIIKGIVENEDVHSFTASVVFQKKLMELWGGTMPDLPTIKQQFEWWRQEAKPETFKPVYGGEYGTPEQMAYYKAFREKYPTLNRTQLNWCYEVVNTGKLRTVTGLIFYWPGTIIETKKDWKGQTKIRFVIPSKEKDVKPVDVKRMIFNYPVSSLATADISQIGAVCTWYRMKSLGLQSFLVSVVHDAEIAEVHPDEIEIMNETCRQGMLDDMLVYLKRCYNIDFDVPLEVEENIGDFWKDKKSWQEKWLQ